MLKIPSADHASSRSPEADMIHAKLAAARAALRSVLIERDEEIDLVLTALLAQEHVLLVGPPGCGKSLLLDSLLSWTGGTKFSVLLNKFSVPEEVLGPVSLSGLKADRYIRVTAGKLPEADFAFIDEVFKASSAILNTLLRILNERTFDAGDGVVRRVPLKLCVAASNEWPTPETGQELAALFDRFTLRRPVAPIRSRAGRERLLWSSLASAEPGEPITPGELEAARCQVRGLPWSGAARVALQTIVNELARDGVRPGDRRQFKTVGVVQAFAFLNGADQVEPEHLEIAAHTLWDDPTEQPAVVNRVIARVANPVGMRISQLLLEVDSLLSATDTKDLAETAKSAAKLTEIDKQLAGLTGNGRLAAARSYVQDELKKLKLASLEAI